MFTIIIFSVSKLRTMVNGNVLSETKDFPVRIPMYSTWQSSIWMTGRITIFIYNSLFVFQSDDPQQNVNSFLTSIFNIVFMLFHTVPFFFLSMVAQKTSKLRYSDWLLRNFNQSESGYLSYHGEQNGGHHAKEHWKLSWKLVSKNSLHFVGSHHSEKQTVYSLQSTDQLSSM